MILTRLPNTRQKGCHIHIQRYEYAFLRIHKCLYKRGSQYNMHGILRYSGGGGKSKCLIAEITNLQIAADRAQLFQDIAYGESRNSGKFRQAVPFPPYHRPRRRCLDAHLTDDCGASTIALDKENAQIKSASFHTKPEAPAAHQQHAVSRPTAFRQPAKPLPIARALPLCST